MAGTYLPKDDVERTQWLNDFVRELTPLATDLNVSAVRIASVQADADAFDYAINQLLTAARRFDKSITALKTQLNNGTGITPVDFPTFPLLIATPPAVTPGIFRRVSLLVRHIKAQPDYTTEIGQRLGIIAPEGESGLVKPTIQSVKALPGFQVRVKFVKGRYKLTLIEGQRANEIAWTLLDKVSSNAFLDTHPPLNNGQPEVRRYRVRYLEKDQPIGDYSDTVMVTTMP